MQIIVIHVNYKFCNLLQNKETDLTPIASSSNLDLDLSSKKCLLRCAHHMSLHWLLPQASEIRNTSASSFTSFYFCLTTPVKAQEAFAGVLCATSSEMLCFAALTVRSLARSLVACLVCRSFWPVRPTTRKGSRWTRWPQLRHTLAVRYRRTSQLLCSIRAHFLLTDAWLPLPVREIASS